VIAKNDDWTDGSEENAKFWSASPSGECELLFDNPASHFDLEGSAAFQPGAYYYIDIERYTDKHKTAAMREWRLSKVSHCEGPSMDVSFRTCWCNESKLTQGTFEISIENEEAWPFFDGKQGQDFGFLFRLAEDSKHESCPYTAQ